jgi:hypothetical protein
MPFPGLFALRYILHTVALAYLTPPGRWKFKAALVFAPPGSRYRFLTTITRIVAIGLSGARDLVAGRYKVLWPNLVAIVAGLAAYGQTAR